MREEFYVTYIRCNYIRRKNQNHDWIVNLSIRHDFETNILFWIFPNFTLDIFSEQTLLVRSKISDLNEVSRRKIFALDLWTTNILVPHLYTMAPIRRQMLVYLYTMCWNPSWRIIFLKQTHSKNLTSNALQCQINIWNLVNHIEKLKWKSLEAFF